MSYIVWPWHPERGVIESLEWSTDVIEAKDGTEQRIQIRQEPRQSFEAQILVDDETELARLRVAIAGWQHRLWGWPCWHEAVRLAAVLPAASSSIPSDTSASDFRDGGLAVVYTSPDLYDVVTVESVESSSLALAGAVAHEHAAGALVMPLRMARMSGPARRDDYSFKATRYTVTMQVTDNTALTTEAAAMQYLGYDVLSDNLWMPGETMPRQIERALDVLDPRTGAWATSARTDYPLITTDHKWRLRTPAQAWAFRKWLYRRAGMLNPVWIPSRRHDLTLSVQPTASATTLEINDVNYRSLGLNVPGMMHIAAFAADGSFVCRQITGATAGSSGRENLTINAGLGFTGVAKISFLCLHRFAADKISMTWDRVGVATCRASMTGVAA
jgi:hypothetical protein